MIAVARKAIEQRRLIKSLPDCTLAHYEGDLVGQPCAPPDFTRTETPAYLERGELSLSFFAILGVSALKKN